MTAEVEILVDRKENVLSVPVLAILQYNGKDHVTKKVDDRLRADARSSWASPTRSSSRSPRASTTATSSR